MIVNILLQLGFKRFLVLALDYMLSLVRTCLNQVMLQRNVYNFSNGEKYDQSYIV